MEFAYRKGYVEFIEKATWNLARIKVHEPECGSGARIQGLELRGELVFKAHRLCVSLNSRLESNEAEEEKVGVTPMARGPST